MDRTYCVECKRKEAKYWDNHYCEECYVAILNAPKQQQLKPVPLKPVPLKPDLPSSYQ